jgi:hypothetical protein
VNGLNGVSIIADRVTTLSSRLRASHPYAGTGNNDRKHKRQESTDTGTGFQIRYGIRH